MLDNLRSCTREGADYLANIPFEQWTQSYDGGLRYGHMTTNLAECINSVLKGTRHLPVTSVVRETYFRLAALFPKRSDAYQGQMQGGYVWSTSVMNDINEGIRRASGMHTVCHSRENLSFRVTEFDRPDQGIPGGCIECIYDEGHAIVAVLMHSIFHALMQ